MVTPLNNVYLNRMPAGIAGDVSRKDGAKIEAVVLKQGEQIAFGKAVAIDTNGEAVAYDGTKALYGFLVRTFPTGEQITGDKVVVDVLRSGYMSVVLNVGTAKKGMTAYLRKTVNGDKAVGNIETAEDTGKCIAIGTFNGDCEEGGIAEIVYNI